MNEAQLWQNPGLVLLVAFLLAVFVRQIFADKRSYPERMAKWEAEQEEKMTKRK